MANIVDKRFTIKNGSVINREKFIKRYKDKIKEAVRGIVTKGSVKDFDFKGKKIKISTKGEGIDLPDLQHDYDHGVYEGIAPGNKTYKKGDKIKKPSKGGGKGTQGAQSGDGEDSFEFVLTEKEFVDLFFEDLELPEMVKKQFTGDTYEIQRAGFSNSGGPSSLSIKQTIIRAFMRRFALKKKGEKEEENLKIDVLKKKKKINFLEDTDLKYNHRDRVDMPSTKAVMFCLMDVSGSMGETEKDLSKRFFILLNLFLKRNYDIVDVVFVRHAEWAEECTEEVFFHGRESGGTMISTGYEKIHEIISARYSPETWNIYISQASDGDNFDHDNENMLHVLTTKLLPITQYYSYIELRSGRSRPSQLFQLFEKVTKQFKNFSIRWIEKYADIFETFRSLFTKANKK